MTSIIPTEIRIRKPNLVRLTSDGSMPQDFAEVMEFFNRGLQSADEKTMYRFITRKVQITPDEIAKRWVPSVPQNITLLVEDVGLGKIVSSATVFYDVNSTAYEQAAQRKPGEVGLTIDPEYQYHTIAKLLIARIARELEDTDKTATIHTDIDFKEELLVMRLLQFKGKLIENYERYKKAGLSGKVYEFKLP